MPTAGGVEVVVSATARILGSPADDRHDHRVDRSRHGLVWLPALVLLATVAQLAVATFVPGIDRFADKAFGARLAAYPAMMLLVPALWWLVVKRRRPEATPPYVAFALVM